MAPDKPPDEPPDPPERFKKPGAVAQPKAPSVDTDGNVDIRDLIRVGLIDEDTVDQWVRTYSPQNPALKGFLDEPSLEVQRGLAERVIGNILGRLGITPALVREWQAEREAAEQRRLLDGLDADNTASSRLTDPYSDLDEVPLSVDSPPVIHGDPDDTDLITLLPDPTTQGRADVTRTVRSTLGPDEVRHYADDFTSDNLPPEGSVARRVWERAVAVFRRKDRQEKIEPPPEVPDPGTATGAYPLSEIRRRLAELAAAVTPLRAPPRHAVPEPKPADTPVPAPDVTIPPAPPRKAEPVTANSASTPRVDAFTAQLNAYLTRQHPSDSWRKR